MIIETLMEDTPKITPESRAVLVENAFDFAKMGYLTYEIPFKFFPYLKKEIHHLPWKAAITKLDFLAVNLRRNKDYDSFRVSLKFYLKIIF